jgi:hypothetical protein
MINSYRGIISVESEGAEDQIHALLSGSARREQGVGVENGLPILRGAERILCGDGEPAIVKNILNIANN